MSGDYSDSGELYFICNQTLYLFSGESYTRKQGQDCLLDKKVMPGYVFGYRFTNNDGGLENELTGVVSEAYNFESKTDLNIFFKVGKRATVQDVFEKLKTLYNTIFYPDYLIKPERYKHRRWIVVPESRVYLPSENK